MAEERCHKKEEAVLAVYRLRIADLALALLQRKQQCLILLSLPIAPRFRMARILTT